MKDLLQQKRVLIAGAGGLLGIKVVKQALIQGAEVIAVDINVKLMRDKLADQQIELDNDRLTLLHLDITDEQSVKSLFSKQHGLTGAVNCTYPRNKAYGAHFFDVSLDSFNENIAMHLGSAFLFTQQCASYFVRQKTSFSLVNISSIYGVIAPKFEVYDNTHMTMPVEYAAIKSAVLHLNKYTSAYINDSLFRINSVSPGGLFDNQPEGFLDKYKKNTHGTGMLDVGEVIGSILFFLSEQSKYVTGQNIIVDDGFSL
jgi:NAD(P)-dependent dehydrogenase (short-subunit alcohol dehydrogenase family)